MVKGVNAVGVGNWGETRAVSTGTEVGQLLSDEVT